MPDRTEYNRVKAQMRVAAEMDGRWAVMKKTVFLVGWVLLIQVANCGRGTVDKYDQKRLDQAVLAPSDMGGGWAVKGVQEDGGFLSNSAVMRLITLGVPYSTFELVWAGNELHDPNGLSTVEGAIFAAPNETTAREWINETMPGDYTAAQFPTVGDASRVGATGLAGQPGFSVVWIQAAKKNLYLLIRLTGRQDKATPEKAAEMLKAMMKRLD